MVVEPARTLSTDPGPAGYPADPRRPGRTQPLGPLDHTSRDEHRERLSEQCSHPLAPSGPGSSRRAFSAAALLRRVAEWSRSFGGTAVSVEGDLLVIDVIQLRQAADCRGTM